MDTNKIRLMREAIDTALVSVGEQFKVQIKAGNASYRDSSVTFKVEANEIGDIGEVEPKEKQDFLRFARSYGFQPSDFGKGFQLANSKVYKIAGLKPRSQKYPVLGESEDGRLFKFDTETVKRGLERAYSHA